MIMKLEVITKLPTEKKHATPLLFVHGAWHGAWCWENFLPYFAEHGFEAHALSLRGHGNSEGQEGLRWHSAVNGYVPDVEQVVNKLGRTPVIIGHSMGGYVAQKYLETHVAPAGVLLASIPVSGIFMMMMRFLHRRPSATLKTLFLLNPWYMVNKPELVKEAFFSDDFPDSEFERLFPHIQSESFRMAMEALLFRLPRPHKVKTPILVLAAENDRVFTLTEERATAKAYETEVVIFPDMAHDMMLERDWQLVADKILQWLKEREL